MSIRTGSFLVLTGTFLAALEKVVWYSKKKKKKQALLKKMCILNTNFIAGPFTLPQFLYVQNSEGSMLNYLKHSQQFNDSFIIKKIEMAEMIT